LKILGCRKLKKKENRLLKTPEAAIARRDTLPGERLLRRCGMPFRGRKKIDPSAARLYGIVAIF